MKTPTLTIENLRFKTYEQAEKLFREGLFGEDLWAEYRHLWQTSSPRFGLRACYCDHCHVN